MKCIFSILLVLSAAIVFSQDKKETTDYFRLIKEVVISENSGSGLIYRLDTLKSKFIPSRSSLIDYFNRDIEFGFKHRRVFVNINYAGYQVDLLCRNDSIFMRSVSSVYPGIRFDDSDSLVIGNFLDSRNMFYGSTKDQKQLIKELSANEEFAFYCGDGNPKTERGKYIDHLVSKGKMDELFEMMKSFNCETQAFGVAGFLMLSKKGVVIPFEAINLINHIKNRNSELVICSGCLSGIVERIYSKN